MDPLIALATEGQLTSINCLVENCDFYVFDKVNGVSCFDILVQQMIDNNFTFEENILEFLEYHAKNEFVNLKDMFFLSPLVRKIDKSGTQFYKKIKTILKKLHTVDKSTVSYKTLLTGLFNAFSAVPKDAVSLIKYMIDKNMICEDINILEMSVVMASSPKLFSWVLSRLTQEIGLTSEFFTGIIYTLFARASCDTYISNNLSKYLSVFRAYSHLFGKEHIENFNKSVELAIKKKYISVGDDVSKFFILRRLLTFFSKTFDYTLSSTNVKLMIMEIPDVQAKFFVTSCFDLLFFTENEQTELFQNFLLSFSESISHKSKQLIDDYIKLFPYISMKYKNHWDTVTTQYKSECIEESQIDDDKCYNYYDDDNDDYNYGYNDGYYYDYGFHSCDGICDGSCYECKKYE